MRSKAVFFELVVAAWPKDLARSFWKGLPHLLDGKPFGPAVNTRRQTDVNHRLRVSGSPLADILMDRAVVPLLRVRSILDVVGDFVLKRGSQLDVNYRASSLSEQTGSFRKGPKPGDRAPDGQLLDSCGQSTSLFATFRTPNFRLLIFQGRRQPAAPKALTGIGTRAHAATDGLVTPLVITTDSTDGSDDVIVLRDPNQRTHVSYGASTPSLYLIRPDGYVGSRCQASDEAELVDYLRRNHGSTATPAGTLASLMSR